MFFHYNLLFETNQIRNSQTTNYLTIVVVRAPLEVLEPRPLASLMLLSLLPILDSLWAPGAWASDAHAQGSHPG